MCRAGSPVVVSIIVLALGGCVTVKTDDPATPEANTVPEIRQARETQSRLQREAREVKDIGDGLDSIATKISEHRVLTGAGSVDTLIHSLIQTTSELRQLAKDILEKGPQYIARVDSFTATLKDAPDTFRKAAALFRAFANDEPYEDLADDYREVATMFDNLASRTQHSSGMVHKQYNREELLRMLQYVRHQERYLDRLEAALYAQGFGFSEIEALVREIDAFSSKFEKLRSQVRDLNAAFRDVEAVATTQRPSVPQRPAAVPAQIQERPKNDESAPAEKPAEAPVSYQPRQATASVDRELSQASGASGKYFVSAYRAPPTPPRTYPSCATTSPVSYQSTTNPTYIAPPTRQKTHGEMFSTQELDEIALRATAAARAISGVSQ